MLNTRTWSVRVGSIITLPSAASARRQRPNAESVVASGGLRRAASSGLRPAASCGLRPAASCGLRPAASPIVEVEEARAALVRVIGSPYCHGDNRPENDIV